MRISRRIAGWLVTRRALLDELANVERLARDRLIALCASEAERAAWMNGVADAVEPLGYDRDAACGPADLLPGLKTLAELRGDTG